MCSIQNARFSSIHTRIVLSKYCAFTNGLLRSLHIERSENRPYSLFPGISGYPWSLKTRLTRCRQAQSSMISSGQCPYGDVAQAIACAPDRSPATDISQEALTNFWSRLGYLVEVRIWQSVGWGLHMSSSQVRKRHRGASRCTIRILLHGASAGRQVCTSDILYWPCVTRCVHLSVARV
ncbi:hypothetical protein BJV77DRAFT_732249 [Russula vinacea]|nr:hypothetical protein BJV77DRAFT_732249 [Russula vinacea]